VSVVGLLLFVVAHAVSVVGPLLLVVTHAGSTEGSVAITPELPVVPFVPAVALSEVA
jgi:hypothetical protein